MNFQLSSIVGCVKKPHKLAEMCRVVREQEEKGVGEVEVEGKVEIEVVEV